EGETARRSHIEGSPWRRDVLTQDELLDRFADFLNSDQSLPADGITQVAIEFGMYGRFVRPGSITLNMFADFLKKEGFMYVIYFSYHMNHAVVPYGYSTTDGLAVMDPNPDEGLIHRQISFFQEGIRAEKPMFIAWPVG